MSLGQHVEGSATCEVNMLTRVQDPKSAQCQTFNQRLSKTRQRATEASVRQDAVLGSGALRIADAPQGFVMELDRKDWTLFPQSGSVHADWEATASERLAVHEVGKLPC